MVSAGGEPQKAPDSTGHAGPLDVCSIRLRPKSHLKGKKKAMKAMKATWMPVSRASENLRMQMVSAVAGASRLSYLSEAAKVATFRGLFMPTRLGSFWYMDCGLRHRGITLIQTLQTTKPNSISRIQTILWTKFFFFFFFFSEVASIAKRTLNT